MLLPGVMGMPVPKVTYDASSRSLLVEWKGEKTKLSFLPSEDHQTKIQIMRHGAVILGKN